MPTGFIQKTLNGDHRAWDQAKQSEPEAVKTGDWAKVAGVAKRIHANRTESIAEGIAAEVLQPPSVVESGLDAAEESLENAEKLLHAAQLFARDVGDTDETAQLVATVKQGFDALGQMLYGLVAPLFAGIEEPEENPEAEGPAAENESIESALRATLTEAAPATEKPPARKEVPPPFGFEPPSLLDDPKKRECEKDVDEAIAEAFTEATGSSAIAVPETPLGAKPTDDTEKTIDEVLQSLGEASQPAAS